MEQEVAREEEKKEGLIEFYDSFKDMFEFFCKNTTIHGTIRLVCSDSNRMKTAFWTLLLLASFGMLYWQFALMFSQYWAYPVVLTMSMHSGPKMFPAITICNLDPYRFELVSEHLVQLDHMAEKSIAFLYGINTSASLIHMNEKNIHIKDLSSIGNLSRSTFKLSQNFSLLRMPGHSNRSGKKQSRVGFRLCNATGGNCFYKTYSSGMDAILEWYRFHYMNIMSQLPVIINISDHEEQIEDMVYSCQYDGEPCRPSDYVHFHHPVFGSCYTFNSKGTDSFWTATKPGIPYGLSLILRAEQKDHIPLLSTVAGVKVMIHNHNQTPFLEHEGFDIRPGIATTIGIQQDEVNRLGGNYGKCTTNGNDVDVKLLYNNSYTLQACLHSCFQHIMVRKCGCGYYYYPLPPGAEYCDYNKQPAWGHCFYQLYNRLRNHHLNCFEQCPKPCRESLYKVSAGTAKWPSAKSQDWVRQALRHQNGYNSTSNRKDIAKVTIFYQQLNYQSVNESPLLTENLLLSSMGSQWSLWFGSSVLSVVEMFELLIDTLVLSLLFCYQRFRSRKTMNVARTPAIPSVSLTLENYRVVREEAAKGDDSAHPHPCAVTVAMDRGDLHLHPFSSKVEMPELCSDVVLNGFRYMKDSTLGVEVNS
ncbi:amiloride-sensitive sodium channel subunit delta [Pezoporus flaviventris]|uniref:amiloride-sensitive sodium channel subunit delta n=1 Tax=Pezoporus flaviventris TaxID=889875 RepID=UPI002AB20D88|nr:amiloride-sensitive sodium channel subunit delta [Pezoporus flaviventris]XP_061306207.1 amiloride-sensitive sodium channel subunit delta [Pezoporus flaviventris]XP_061306209.1 amiloride-sensitive sodium channel subunit delta [Pezoporus flaviventris]XP_061306210.1 amiloride-sensitive sodium channel subunit delta [Pezoporus flaviventris]